MPTIDYVLSQMSDARVFSKIDLENAYLQIPLDASSRKLAVINTQEGLFQYNYLPFGTKSSSALCQCFITGELNGVQDAIVYQDYILLMSKNESEHLVLLDQVFSRLQSAGIKINAEKSKYFTDNVPYLGYIFSKEGVIPTKNKMDAVLKCPYPKNIKEVQSFIGMCNYYSSFIKNFSSLFSPLYKLLKKNAIFIWGDEQKRCVDKIKMEFSNAKMLKLFDPKLPTAVETDASLIGIGAVLSQKHMITCGIQFNLHHDH